MTLKIGIVGCAGRMGITLLREVLMTENAALSGGLEQADNPVLGKDLGELAGGEAVGVFVSANTQELFEKSDAIIDFTRPASTLAFAKIAAELGKIHVIGTTGFTPEQEWELSDCAKKTAIVRSPNMSLCVNLFMKLVEQVAGILDDDYDIEIVEMHHRHKVDAPSGTALGLGRAAAAGRKVTLDKAGVFTRYGHTGEREKGQIGFATLRGGDVVGDHTVTFAGLGERLEITHKASDRRIYARGAVRCALWAAGKKPGLYSMADMLGL